MRVIVEVGLVWCLDRGWFGWLRSTREREGDGEAGRETSGTR